MENEKSEELVKAIKNATQSSATVASGTVVAVDESDYTCDIKPDADAPILYNVRLTASIDDEPNKGFVPIPVIGSRILAAKITASLWFVLLFSQVKKIIFNADEVIFNQGTNQGLVKINSLVEKLNLLEDKVNSIINNYNTHTHPETGTTTSPTSSTISGTLTNTQKSDLENQKIKQ